jgi:hypothetical protein
LKVNRRFGATYRLNLQGRKIRRAKNQPKAELATFYYAGFLLGLFFEPEDGSDMFLRKVG